MGDAEDRLAIARAIARRNLNWVAAGFAFVTAALIVVATNDSSKPPEGPAMQMDAIEGLALIGFGPALGVFVAFVLSRIHISRLKVPRVGPAALACIAVFAVILGTFATSWVWMVGSLLPPESGVGLPGETVPELGLILDAVPQALTFGLFGLLFTGWLTIPIAILIGIGAAAATNREIAKLISVR